MTSICSHHSIHSSNHDDDDDLSFDEGHQQNGEHEEKECRGVMTITEEKQTQKILGDSVSFGNVMICSNNVMESDTEAGENEHFLSSLVYRRSSNFPSTRISIRSSSTNQNRTSLAPSLRGSAAFAFHFENEYKEKSFFQCSPFLQCSHLKRFQNIGEICAGLPGIIMVIWYVFSFICLMNIFRPPISSKSFESLVWFHLCCNYYSRQPIAVFS